MKHAQAFKVVGRPEPRLDGVEKVTGKALYTVDVKLPSMAYGKILRSPYAHARLVHVDAARAEALPGVFAVITGNDQTSCIVCPMEMYKVGGAANSSGFNAADPPKPEVVQLVVNQPWLAVLDQVSEQALLHLPALRGNRAAVPHLHQQCL